jgi:putative transcriptional regulator
LGLTQEQFASRLSVTFPTVNRWERKHAKLSPMAQKLLIKVVEQMGEDGADLLAKYFSKKYFSN